MDRREAIKRTSILLGGSLSASAVAGVLGGCQPSNSIDWTPVFLDREQAGVVEAIADCILPATSTPGALDVGVPGFIDTMLMDVYSPAEQSQFTAGLTALREASQAKYQEEFIACSKEEQTALLSELESATSSQPSFIKMAKELTLLGYFTAEPIMTKVLNYNPVPGKYEACVEMEPNTVVGVDNNVF